MERSSRVVTPVFQFTHPVWGATPMSLPTLLIWEFQFTHPVWGATIMRPLLRLLVCVFQFTHPVWGATLNEVVSVIATLVSIHAPRVGCD